MKESVNTENIVPEAVIPAEEKPVELFDALEAATLELKGIQAICTANAIQNLWNWTGKEDLLKAKANIDYLLKKPGD